MFNAINQALQKCQASVDAAEAHGIICGFLGFNSQQQDHVWLRYILPSAEGDSGEQGRRVLLGLKNYVAEQLQDGVYPVNPLLPADDCELGLRSAALGRWCAGYLLGLSLAGLTDLGRLSPEAKEFVEDLTHLAQLDETSVEGDDAETQERAYSELFEYLRVGMLAVRPEPEIAPPPPSQPRRLH